MFYIVYDQSDTESLVKSAIYLIIFILLSSAAIIFQCLNHRMSKHELLESSESHVYLVDGRYFFEVVFCRKLLQLMHKNALTMFGF